MQETGFSLEPLAVPQRCVAMKLEGTRPTLLAACREATGFPRFATSVCIGKGEVSLHFSWEMTQLWNISSLVPRCFSSQVIPPQHPQTALQNWKLCSKGPRALWQALGAGLKNCPSLYSSSLFICLSVYPSICLILQSFPLEQFPLFTHSSSSSFFLFSHS